MENRVVLNQALRSIILKGSAETEERYERELAAAETERKKAQAEFKNNTAPKIKALKEQIRDLSAQIKMALPSEKVALGEQLKKLNAQVNTLKTPPVNRFAYLDSDIKAYAGSQLLFKSLLNPEQLKQFGVAFDYNEDGRLVVDTAELRESTLGNKIRESADYIFGRTHDLSEKITQASDINNIILMDAKRLLGIVPDVINFSLIEECHNAFEAEKAELERKNKEIGKRREESLTGIKVLKEYNDGYTMYEMLPSPVYDENGKVRYHTSLKYESDEMGHCVGRGGYNEKIGKKDWHFYSLRGPDENGVLVPHCTISIENGRLAQIKGNSNRAVKNRYIADVRDFVKSLDMPIPVSEKERIGYVKDLNNQEVDLFDLQPGAKLNSLTLASGDYKGMQLKNIEYAETVLLEGKVDIRDFREASAIRSIGALTLNTAQDAAFYNQVPLNAKKLIVNGESVPEHFGNAEAIKLEKISHFDFSRNWKNIRHLELENDFQLNVVTLPVFAEGISGGQWGDTSMLSTRELLSKMFGSSWIEQHYREEGDKKIIDTDLDLSHKMLTRLPADMKNLVVQGTINLSDNRLNDRQESLALFECDKMVIHDTFVNFNPDRFKSLPFPKNGIVCNNNSDIDFNNQDFGEVIRKMAIIDKSLISVDGDKVKIDGNLNLLNVPIFSAVNFPYKNIKNVEINGALNAPGWMSELPECKKIYLSSLSHNIVLPDSTEEVIITSSYGDFGSVRGHNLKKVEFKEDRGLTCQDLQRFIPGVEYQGQILLTSQTQKMEPYDFSDIKINGTIRINSPQIVDDVIRLPQCKEVQFFTPVTEKELFMLHRNTEKLKCQELFDLDMLPTDSRIKYVSINHSSFASLPQSESMNFLHKASARGIICDSGLNIDFSQDLSDCLLKDVELRWQKKIKDISTLPQMENLSITSPHYDFDSKFLKDASPLLKRLDLSYMETDDQGLVDFTALPENVTLEHLEICDSRVQPDLLETLPKSLKKLRLLRCKDGDNLNFEALNRLPDLQSLDICQMEIPVNAFDNVDPKRLAAIEVTGNSAIMMRAEEIVAIDRLPSSPENDKIKQMHQWLVAKDSKTPYDVKQVVFYTTVNDILSGKHPQNISQEEIDARIKGIENYKLDSCAKIIMANEQNHKVGDNKAGRAILDEHKDEKPGFYGHFGRYYAQNSDISKVGKVMKSILTRNICHHPDFAKSQNIVADRMAKHISSLQINFNCKLAEKADNLKAYVHMDKYDHRSYSFNKAVKTMQEYKSYN